MDQTVATQRAPADLSRIVSWSITASWYIAWKIPGPWKEFFYEAYGSSISTMSKQNRSSTNGPSGIECHANPTHSRVHTHIDSVENRARRHGLRPVEFGSPGCFGESAGDERNSSSNCQRSRSRRSSGSEATCEGGCRKVSQIRSLRPAIARWRFERTKNDHWGGVRPTFITLFFQEDSSDLRNVGRPTHPATYALIRRRLHPPPRSCPFWF